MKHVRTPKFPDVVDNTMLTTFASCPYKFFNNYVLRLEPPDTSEHLIAGAAFAKGVEVARTEYYINGKKEITAIEDGVVALIKEWGYYETPKKSVKTLPNIIYAFLEYFRHFKMSVDSVVPYITDNVNGIEYTFGVDLLNIKHPDTKDPIIYGGRFDMLGINKTSKKLVLVDEKTTTSLYKFTDKYLYSTQFMGYKAALQSIGLEVTGIQIRATAIQVGKIDFASPFYKIPDELASIWKEQAKIKLKAMVKAYKKIKGTDSRDLEDVVKWAKVYPKNLGVSCMNYNQLCPYVKLCNRFNPTEGYGFYNVNTWSPLGSEESVEDRLNELQNMVEQDLEVLIHG